jgi:DNA-binding transcriptional LysR family regulator
VNLNQLRYAVTVAETGSFSRAAELCLVTQPALSKAVAQLEEQLGGRLFERSCKRVELTPFGRAILPYVERILLVQDDLTREAATVLRRVRTTLRVGMSPLVGPRVLDAVSRLREAQPEVDVVLSEANIADLHGRLAADQLDVIVSPGATQHSGWERRLVYEEELWFVPRNSPSHSNGESPANAAHVGEICHETFVMVPDICGLARVTRELFQSRGLHLRTYPGEALSYAVLEEWAALGLGAAILPRSKVSAESAVPLLDESGQPVLMGVEGLWRDAASPYLQAFIGHLATGVPVATLAGPAAK